jgi:uridine monophosphate synthetase
MKEGRRKMRQVTRDSFFGGGRARRASSLRRRTLFFANFSPLSPRARATMATPSASSSAPTTAAETPFFAALEARAAAINSLLCVGLDPHAADLAADAKSAAGAEAFCMGLIEVTAPFAAAFKPNAAFFEVFGADGAAALKRVVAALNARGLPCVLDVKRGDISTTAEA